MAITSLDGLIDATGNNAQSLVVNKASIANTTAGGFCSLWRATGTPAQGGVPSTVAVCTNATTGAFGINNASGGLTNYLARAFLLSSNAATDVQFHDRLSHMGGLSGIVTTAQTVNVDASDGALTSRIGSSDYGDVQWWLEWYTDTGATASNATVAVTYDDNSTGNLAVIAVGGTVRASRMIPLLPAVAGRKIKSVQSVTLSASTGTAGSFGVTATRALCGLSLGLANAGVVADWAYLGLPQIAPNACLQMIMIPGTTTSGALYGSGKVVTG